MGDVRGGSVAVCGDGRAVSCMLLWFEVVCLVFSAMLPRPTECGTWPTNILARLETPTSSSSPAASLVLPDECGKNLFHLTSSASGDVLADYSHRTPNMPSPAANSASINPAASCRYPFPMVCCADSFLSISSSNASWSLCCQAIAGVVGRPQCTINDSLSFSRRPARPAHGRRRPATHRKIYNLGSQARSRLRRSRAVHRPVSLRNDPGPTRLYVLQATSWRVRPTQQPIPATRGRDFGRQRPTERVAAC